MGTKLFVGGLPWTTGEAELREAFGVHGSVIDAVVLTDRDTGRSRGCGFIAFSTDAEAAAAMQAMDGASLGGRRIAVREAHDRRSGPPDRPSRPPPRSQDGGDFRGPPRAPRAEAPFRGRSEAPRDVQVEVQDRRPPPAPREDWNRRPREEAPRPQRWRDGPAPGPPGAPPVGEEGDWADPQRNRRDRKREERRRPEDFDAEGDRMPKGRKRRSKSREEFDDDW